MLVAGWCVPACTNPPRLPAAGCLLTEPVCTTPWWGGKWSTASHRALPTVRDPHVRPGNSGRGAEAKRGTGNIFINIEEEYCSFGFKFGGDDRCVMFCSKFLGDLLQENIVDVLVILS
ncbi:hypothetical protein E2C01_027838 [Portunus trituberculatus]|uniref:Uncharacterized protein n=1 Tax=Portunus trituberculatus TaxID=210409 RepID=A0A5B7EMM0_PORTR|nr:hypothetical protein [Portunus trituberculatus]